MSDNQNEKDLEQKYNEESREILKEFIEELNSCDLSNGEYPKLGSDDLRYTASLQGKRLSDNNASVKYNYSMDNSIRGSAIKLDKDTRYITRMPFSIMDSKTEYSVAGKVKKREKYKKTMYANVIWLKNQNKKEKYSCPDCGAVSTVGQLLTGCPFCQTRFMMSELFPKVTNYYDHKANTYITTSVAPFSLFGVLILLCIFGFVNFDTLKTAFTSDDIVPKITEGAWIAGYTAVGILSGYVLKVVANILYGIIYVSMYLPSFFRFLKTRRRLPEFMRGFEKNFTLDHFIGKLIYLIRMMVYSEDYENCAVYCGEPVENECRDIIDMNYFGFINAKNYYIENDYAYIDIDVHMFTIRCKGHHISKRIEVFELLIYKNIHAETDNGFSIHKIECRNCGSSFDATKEKYCPYCRSDFNLPDYDWVIKKFKRK